jgi:hypothetical protein
MFKSQLYKDINIQVTREEGKYNVSFIGNGQVFGFTVQTEEELEKVANRLAGLQNLLDMEHMTKLYSIHGERYE